VGDAVLAATFDLGRTHDDIRHLERLSDPASIAFPSVRYPRP